MVGYDERKEHQLSTLFSGIAGTLSGMLSRFIGQPLDVLKIRFQLQHEPLQKRNGGYYTSMGQATNRIFKEESFKAFWKGHIPAQFLSGFYGLVQFGTYEVLTKRIGLSHDEGRKKKAIVHFLCGSCSGALATTISFPFDTIRTRLVSQGEPKTYSGVSNAFRKMVAVEGFTSLFKGLVPTIVQIVPYAGIQFGSFEFFTSVYAHLFLPDQNVLQSIKLPVVGNLVCGSLSGIVAKISVYPLDLTKKRLQVQGFHLARSHFGRVMEYKGPLDVLLQTLKIEGFKGLYKGLGPGLVKALVSTALTFTFYEEISNFFTQLRL